MLITTGLISYGCHYYDTSPTFCSLLHCFFQQKQGTSSLGLWLRVENEGPRFSDDIVHCYTFAATNNRTAKKGSPVSGFFGKSGYKFWVLAAVLLLAFWSMFTGSVSLKWSSGDLTRFSDTSDLSFLDDLDALELEDIEKVVKKMWDVYTHSAKVCLLRFWLEAFEAAYEYLSSDVPGVRDTAISEIAKLSIRSVNLDSQSKSTSRGRKTSEQAAKKEEIAATGTNL